MLYLIEQLLVPLTIAAVFGGGVAGWSWHCIRNRDAMAALEAERERLRAELLGYVGMDDGETRAPVFAADTSGLERQIAALRRDLEGRDTTIEDNLSRINTLELELASLRAAGPAVVQDTSRIDTLETALREAEARAADLDRRAALLESDLEAATRPTEPGIEDKASRWRMRYLDSRVAHLEAREQQVQAVPEPQPALDDELNRARWKTRYLDARVRYLEGQAAQPVAAPMAPEPPADPEAENRKRWRQRYLEARVAWLEGRVKDAGGGREGLLADIAARDARIAELDAAARAPRADDPRVAQYAARIADIEPQVSDLERRKAELEGALAASRSEHTHVARRAADLEADATALRARITALEAELAARPAESPETGRLRWRSRYLDSRVRYLEDTMAAQPKAPPPAPLPPRDDSFAPLMPAGAEVRPPALPAPRDGARDDLRMIAGIGPRIESTLNSLGVYHFDQIAAWTPANVDWIERYLAFKGRIGRETWIDQAKALARGEETEGKRRYLAGEQV